MAKKPAKRPVVGDLIQVGFWDHAEGSDDVLRFEVIGRVYKITRRAYCVRSWGYINDVDRAGDSNSDNETTYAIVKRAIDSIRILK